MTLRSFARAVLPPIVTTGLLIGAYAGAVRLSGSEFFAFDTWIKWDSGHYITIADRGYEFMSCAEVPGQHPAQWCGNSGWFPGYPYLIRGLHLVTGAGTNLLAILVSQVFSVLCLALLWNLFLARRGPALLLLCAFAPGTYYFLVAFPMSMTVCFMLLTLWAHRRQHHAIALLTGIVVGFTYPSGICLAGVLAGSLLIERWRGPRRGARAWVPVAGPILGFCLVMLFQHVAVGHWNAFFLTQEKYQHGVNNPVAVLWQRSAYIWVWKPGWQTGIQSLTAAALVIVGATLAAAALARRRHAAGDAALALHGLVYWLFPLVLGGAVSPYRSESLLVPAVAGLGRLPGWVRLVLIVVAVCIWMVMATEFAHGWLV